MNDTARIENPADALPFLLGGKATFTLRSKPTQTRFTFRIEEKEKGGKFYRVLAHDGTHYGYLGCIVGDRYVRDRELGFRSDAKIRLAFEWFYGRTVKKMDLSDVELWHEGRCSRCHRPLTDPNSIQTGLGPVCRNRV